MSMQTQHTQPVAAERQVISRIAIGDRDALAELYACYQHTLFSYLLQLTPDHGLAEEILQDTLVAVWKCAQSYEGRSSVRTWLIGIARRHHQALACQRIGRRFGVTVEVGIGFVAVVNAAQLNGLLRGLS